MTYASPHYLAAISAYCHRELQRVEQFRQGKLVSASVSADEICAVLDGGPQYFPLATADQLVALREALAHIAQCDPDLHDLAKSRMQDVDAELHRYDDD